MKRIDLRCDPSAPGYDVVITHYALSQDGHWRTTGAVEIVEVTEKENAERLARGFRGKGREIDINFNEQRVGHTKLHSVRLVWS